MPDSDNLKHKIEIDNEIHGQKIRESVEKIKKGEDGKEKYPPAGGEKKVESAALTQSVELEEKTGSMEMAGFTASQSALRKKQSREKKIEEVLSEDLEDIYINMDPEKQREFKIAGERTVKEINTLIQGAKFKIKKIVSLIRKWLSIIPGINKFFLDQESKIKTDKILSIKNEFDR